MKLTNSGMIMSLLIITSVAVLLSLPTAQAQTADYTDRTSENLYEFSQSRTQTIHGAFTGGFNPVLTNSGSTFGNVTIGSTGDGPYNIPYIQVRYAGNATGVSDGSFVIQQTDVTVPKGFTTAESSRVLVFPGGGRYISFDCNADKTEVVGGMAAVENMNQGSSYLSVFLPYTREITLTNTDGTTNSPAGDLLDYNVCIAPEGLHDNHNYIFVPQGSPARFIAAFVPPTGWEVTAASRDTVTIITPDAGSAITQYQRVVLVNDRANINNINATGNDLLAEATSFIRYNPPASGVLSSNGFNAMTFEAPFLDVAPTVTISSTTAADSATNSQTITYTATFNEDVTGFDAISDITLAGSATATVAAPTGSGTDYTFVVTATTDGTVIVSIPAGAAVDASLNDNTASDTYTVTIDTAAPTFSSAATASPTTIAVTASQSLAGTATASDFTVSGNTVSSAAISGSTITLTVGTTITPTDTLTVSYTGTTITDAAGNALVSFSDQSVTNNVSAAPTVTGVTTAAPAQTYGQGEGIPVSVTFSESVTVTGTPQLTLDIGGTLVPVDIDRGSGTTDLVFRYVVAAGHNTDDFNYAGTDSLALNGGTIVATSGGAAADLTLPTPSSSALAGIAIIVDATPPEIVRAIITGSDTIEVTTDKALAVSSVTTSDVSITVDGVDATLNNVALVAVNNIVINATNLSFADEIIVMLTSVTDLDGNLFTDNSYTLTEQDKGLLGTDNMVSITDADNVFIIQDTIPPNSVLVVETGKSVNATLDLSNIQPAIDTDNNDAFIPEFITITRPGLSILLPANTTISNLPDSGQLILSELARTPDLPPSSVIDFQVEIGSPDLDITLNNSTRIAFTGLSGSTAYYIDSAGTTNLINRECAGDTSDTIGIDSGECRIVVGSDLVVWTYHFTTFGAFGMETSGGSGGNIAQSRPHFGLSPLTDTQLVSCGFSMDGECRDVVDYHVPYDRTVIQTGTTHDFTLKPFNNYNLKMLQLGLGVEEVGDSINTAEALITVELAPDYKSDIGYTIQSVMTRNNLENVIDEVTESNVSLSTEQCMAGLEKDCLVVHINDVMFRDVFYSEPFVINVIDTKRLSSTNYLNEGITVTGESLNPAPEYHLTTGKKVEQAVERLNLVRTDKVNDIWTDENGNKWTQNNHDTWIQVTFTPYVEPKDPTMSVMTRINNNFDDMILLERERAILVWDSTVIQGEIKPSFSYTFDERLDKLDDPKILKKLDIESEKALEILRAANYNFQDE